MSSEGWMARTPASNEAAKLVGLHEDDHAAAAGYETDIGEGGGLLLRAQRQQLGLARAAMEARPGGAETRIRASTMTANAVVQGNRTHESRQMMVVIITHRNGRSTRYEKIAIMRNGTVAAFGDSERIYETFSSSTVANRNIGGKDHAMSLVLSSTPPVKHGSSAGVKQCLLKGRTQPGDS